MSGFFLSLLGTGAGFLLAILVTAAIFKPLTGLLFRCIYDSLYTNQNPENPSGIFGLIKKINPGRFPEKSTGGEDGKPSGCLFGEKIIYSPWRDLLFNPVYLNRPVQLDFRTVGTEVTIGPYTRRPLRLKIPILIGGMAYGTVLSAQVKQALAMGATMAGTAANTGNGFFLPAERSAAEKLIVQYAKGYWTKDLEVLKEADAIEVHLGNGIWGPFPMGISPRRLARNPRLRVLTGTVAGEKSVVPARLLEAKDPIELGRLMESLRQKTAGIPVGVKIKATQRLERELDLLLAANPDFVAIEGLEGGSFGEFGRNIDSLGIPTLFAIHRAHKFLKGKKLTGKITLLAGGGLFTPVDFLKAMALGADAVFIGAAALAIMLHKQVAKALPWKSPVSLILSDGKRRTRLSIPQAAQSLADFLQVSVREMQIIALSLGKENLHEVSAADLVALDQRLASYLGISWCGREWETWETQGRESL